MSDQAVETYVGLESIEGPVSEVEPLAVADRCDRCPAQAFVRVTIPSVGSSLLFCGHHFAKHEVALAAHAPVVDDFRHLINEKPSASSA